MVKEYRCNKNGTSQISREIHFGYKTIVIIFHNNNKKETSKDVKIDNFLPSGRHVGSNYKNQTRAFIF